MKSYVQISGLIVISLIFLLACSFSGLLPSSSSTPTLTPTTSHTPTSTATPTPTATPTLRDTPTEYLTQTPVTLLGVNTVTPIPSITPFPSSTSSLPGVGFESVQISGNNIFWGICKPNITKFTVKVQHPDEVHRVYLFFRLMSTKKDDTTPWVGTVTDNDGGGVFLYTLKANNIPYKYYYSKAWVQVQFVAADDDDKVIGRTQVYARSIVLAPCP